MLPIVVQFFSKFGVKHGILEFIEQQHETADALYKVYKTNTLSFEFNYTKRQFLVINVMRQST